MYVDITSLIKDYKEFLKQVVTQLKNNIEFEMESKVEKGKLSDEELQKLKLNITKSQSEEIQQLRKTTFEFSKDLSFFENQILIFLMYIKELEHKILI